MTLIRILKKYGQILSKHQKLRIFELVVLMIIGGFMEMMSVSLIIPFMNVVLDSERTMQNKYIALICSIFEIESHRKLLIFLSLVMAVIYILKNAFLIFQMMVQNKFVLNNQFMIQKRLLHSYLMRPYEYFLYVKSGVILRIIGDDTISAFVLLTTLLSMFSELVVSGFLVITIFFIAPTLTIEIAVLLSIMLILIQTIIRPYLRTAGIRNRDAYANMNQWLIQSIQGVKDVKIAQKENFFEKSYADNGSVYVRTSYINQTLGLIPRFMIEAVAMSAFFIMVAVLIYRGTELEAIVPMLSAVAMAAVRLLPSTNRISHSMAQVAIGEPILDKMIENLKELEESEEEIVRRLETNNNVSIGEVRNSIELENIVYSYPTGKSPVLEGASMRIHVGESVGIVGTSGAGKTTAVDIMLGLLKPQSGKIIVDDTGIELDYTGWLNQIGYIPQSIFMIDGDIRENVAFGVAEEDIDEDKVWDALREAAIDKDVKTFPDGLDTQLGERGIRLSGGQRQRIGIARALYNNPSVLFFDEATSALDNETEADIMESINHLHGTKTMIIIAHRLTTIEGCDHIFRVEGGKITQER